MRVLVLSGGGAKGAAQCGALKHLIGDLGICYDAFCGISVGSINSSFLAMYGYGQEKQSIIDLEAMWSGLNTKKVYKRWFPFGRLSALWKPSVYNSQPIIDMLNAGIKMDKIHSSGKQVVVGAVSLTSGEYKVFDKDYHDFPNAVCASAAYPGMLLPIELDGQLWTDGGVKEITPLKAAIDLGATEIDIIISSPVNDTKKFPYKPNAINVITRTLDLMSDEVIANDLETALEYNELVLQGKTIDKRFIKINIIRPTENLTDDSLDFSPENLKRMFDIGYQDAKNQYKP